MRVSEISLQTRCLDAFHPPDRERGASYFNRRRVSLGARESDGIAATVEGSGGAVYEVRLDWSRAAEGGRLGVSCSCPRCADFILCKHLWATIVAFDAARFTEPVPGKGRLSLEIRTAGEPEAPRPSGELDPQPEFRFEDQLPRRRGPFLRGPELGFVGDLVPAPPSEPAQPAWRRKLRSIRPALAGEHAFDRPAPWPEHREVFYRINVASCFDLDQMVVELYLRKARPGGELGPFQRLNLIHASPLSFEDAADHDLLALLKASPTSDFDPYAARYRTSYSQSRGTVPAVLYDSLLPKLCATGRFGWLRDHSSDPARAKPLAWDGGEAWRFVLVLGEDEQAGGTIRMRGQLRRGEESRPLAEPVLLLANGVAMWRDRIGRLAAADAFPWISLLRSEGEIAVPAAELDVLLEELSALPDLPQIEMPAAWRWGEARPVPRPRLTLRPSLDPGSAELEGEVSFDYEDCLVPARRRRSRVFDRRRRRLVHRDRAAEQAALERLYRLGMTPMPVYPFERCDVRLSEQVLRRAVEPLITEGWWIEAEGHRVRPPGGVSLSLASGIDWFELHGGADFGGAVVELPKLLAALARGERMIRLDDGSQGMLPEAWLERFGPLARLAHGDDGGALRYLPSQAALLDALLAAEPQVDVDRAFARLRDRLRSFERVEPAREPAGFCGELRAYQRDGLGWLELLESLGLGGCLADDMGLGKTVQVLALLLARQLRPSDAEERRPSLIVAPRSVIHNWLEEAARFTPQLAVVDYSGPGRKQLLPELAGYQLAVTTYGLLRRDLTELRQVAFDYVVLDEAQAIKNASSLAAKAARLLRAEHRLALTGTPVENHLGELWSIFEFLNPGMLGSLPAFKGLTRSRSLGAAFPAGTAPEAASRKPPLAPVAGALKPFLLRRTKGQVLADLPAKTEQTLYCQLDRRQWLLYRELRDHYRAALDRRIEQQGLAKTKIHVLEALLRLRQAACHPGLVDPERRHHPSAKLETLLEQLDEVLEEGHKALVFSQFVSLLEIVRERLDRRKTPYEYLDGRTRDRQRRIERFQTDPRCRLFLISLKAGGLGLNLTAADYVYILDPWWNPAVEAQAVDRAHRIGQTRPVNAYRLIASGTVEEKILELQQSKRELADAILAASGSMIQNLTADDLRLLLS